MKTTARVIVDVKCSRKCSYCVNTYKHIIEQARKIKVGNWEELKTYDEIIVTGGEPTESPERTDVFLQNVRTRFPDKTIYLYTARYSFDLLSWIRRGLLDGIHYTLHENGTPRDRSKFEHFQEWCIQRHARASTMSFRLSINGSFGQWVRIDPGCWDRIELKKQMDVDTCELPAHEDLFILRR